MWLGLNQLSLWFRFLVGLGAVAGPPYAAPPELCPGDVQSGDAASAAPPGVHRRQRRTGAKLLPAAVRSLDHSDGLLPRRGQGNLARIVRDHSVASGL